MVRIDAIDFNIRRYVSEITTATFARAEVSEFLTAIAPIKDQRVARLRNPTYARFKEGREELPEIAVLSKGQTTSISKSSRTREPRRFARDGANDQRMRQNIFAFLGRPMPH